MFLKFYNILFWELLANGWVHSRQRKKKKIVCCVILTHMRTHISTKNKHTFIELKPCGVLCQGSAMNPLLSRQSGKLLAFFLALKHTFLNVVHNSIFGNGGFLFIFLLSQRTSHKKKDYLYLERYSFREDQNILKN